MLPFRRNPGKWAFPGGLKPEGGHGAMGPFLGRKGLQPLCSLLAVTLVLDHSSLSVYFPSKSVFKLPCSSEKTHESHLFPYSKAAWVQSIGIDHTKALALIPDLGQLVLFLSMSPKVAGALTI